MVVFKKRVIHNELANEVKSPPIQHGWNALIFRAAFRGCRTKPGR